MIFFEPTTFNNMKPAMLALKMQKVVSFHQLPHFHFPMAEMDIQHNFSEYGLFNGLFN
ncbi:YopJ family acetyltransferase [Bartonella birtlesii]|uniref:YopJ family acetyltransferase n=1 Tax=Bartonella birtlesii TaxID=111504 RepID=UPI003D79CDE9